MTEREIFLEAMEIPTPKARAAYLQRACGLDARLRQNVDALLKEHFSDDDLLTRPAAELNRAGFVEFPLYDPPSKTVGRYKLLEKIGEGGMGEVWMAEQDKPVCRRVALKLIKVGMDTRSVIARFEAEGQALALMEHPNIARVFDAGATEAGRPYLVMELVRGIKITEFCDEHQLSTRDRIELFIKVCQAIQHAHQKGIIHRDIKPSNILITVNDGVPVPKVIDFGIAKAIEQKLTDKTLFTEFQALVGTPAYMSPEQTDMTSVDVDTRSDIYSLGVLLYELLVGQTPFDAREMMQGGLDVLRRLIREKDPVKPSTKLKSLPGVELTTAAQRRGTDAVKLTYQLRGDVDWIVMKCLEKDRARRYATANGLATDLKRHLAHEPVVARPPSTAYRFQKFARRNKLAVATAAIVTLVLALGVSAVIFVQYRANQDYRQRLYVSEIGRAGISWQAGQSSHMLALLDQCPKELRHWEWNFLSAQANLWSETVFLTATNLKDAALSADGQSLVVATTTGYQILDFPTGQRRSTLSGGALSSWRDTFAMSPLGDQFATVTSSNSTIRIWNLRTGERMVDIIHADAAHALAWTPDGQQLASAGSDGSIRLWDARTGAQQRVFPSTSTVMALAFSPDGRTLAVGAQEAAVQLWDVTNGIVTRTLQTTLGHINRLVFSPDGQRLAVGHATFGGFQRLSRVWHLANGESLDLHSSSSAQCFAFSPDSRRLLVGDEAGTIRLWDLGQRTEIARISALPGSCRSVQFLADGGILSVGGEGTIKLWQARPSGIMRLSGHTGSLRTLAFSPDSRLLASAGIDGQVIVWDAQHGHRSQFNTNHPAGGPAVTFSPDGHIASSGRDGMVQAWNPATLRTDWTQSLAPAGEAWWLAYSPDNKRLFAASFAGTVTTLDAATGRPMGKITGFLNPTDGLAVSPDGRLLAVVQKQRLSVWIADGSKELWQAPASLSRCAAFSPDGKWIATGGQDSLVSLWEVASGGRVRRVLRGHAATVTGVAFSPDGRRLVSSGIDGVKIWDPSIGAELLSLPLQGDGAWHVAFSPDGKSIAAAGGDGIVTIWKTE